MLNKGPGRHLLLLTCRFLSVLFFMILIIGPRMLLQVILLPTRPPLMLQLDQLLYRWVSCILLFDLNHKIEKDSIIGYTSKTNENSLNQAAGNLLSRDYVSPTVQRKPSSPVLQKKMCTLRRE